MTPQELRQLREAMGLRQVGLYAAAQLGRSQAPNVQGMFVSRMERGARPITRKTADRVMKLAISMGVDFGLV